MAELKMFVHNQEAEAVVNTIVNSTMGGDIPWVDTKKPGHYVFYICPPFSSKGLSGILVFKHYNIPSPTGDGESWTDLRKTYPNENIPNPIQDVIDKYEKLGVDVNDYKSGSRAYINVLVMETPDKPQGILTPTNEFIPHVLQHTPSTLQWIHERLHDRYYPDPITHPLKGCPVRITRVHKGSGANIQVSYERNVLPQRGWYPTCSPEQQLELANNILGNLRDLYKIWPIPDSAGMAQYQAAADRLEVLLDRQLKRAQNSPALSGNEAPLPSLPAPTLNMPKPGDIPGSLPPPPPPAANLSPGSSAAPSPNPTPPPPPPPTPSAEAFKVTPPTEIPKPGDISGGTITTTATGSFPPPPPPPPVA